MPIESIQFNGAAANAERMSNSVNTITSGKGAVHQATHENDFVATLFGGNAVTSHGHGRDVGFMVFTLIEMKKSGEMKQGARIS